MNTEAATQNREHKQTTDAAGTVLDAGGAVVFRAGAAGAADLDLPRAAARDWVVRPHPAPTTPNHTFALTQVFATGAVHHSSEDVWLSL